MIPRTLAVLLCLGAPVLAGAALADAAPPARGTVEVHTGPKPRLAGDRRVSIVPKAVTTPGADILPVRLRDGGLPPSRSGVTVVRGPVAGSARTLDGAGGGSDRRFDAAMLRVLLDVCEPTADPGTLVRDAFFPAAGD